MHTRLHNPVTASCSFSAKSCFLSIALVLAVLLIPVAQGSELSTRTAANLALYGQTQGAGTPNAIGIWGLYPLRTSANGVFFIDALANVSLSDFNSSQENAFSSSIINTTVKGGTLATSSRLGYRWIDSDRAWMFGLNAGYDTRDMATGSADTGVAVTDSQTVFFQQVAFGAEAISSTWRANAYALVPIGNVEQRLNSVYEGGALQTYGLDIGRHITPAWIGAVGYYYQDGDHINGSGARGRLAYNIGQRFVAGINVSYDDAFKTRVFIDLSFFLKSAEPIANRNVRVHDSADIIMTGGGPGGPGHPR